MTPFMRERAAIELLDLVIAAARENGPAADTLISRYFKTRRYAGSKDRRAVRALVYDAIRRHGDLPASGAAALGDDAAQAMPAWLNGRLDGLGLEGRAPLDLRVNTLKAEREAVLAALPEGVPTALSPIGVRLPEGFAIEPHSLWRDGLVEVQDEGSQLVANACRVAPGMTVVDLCAGAGGKTLALAAAMRNEGRLIACDTDRARLSRLRPRAERAGAAAIDQRLLDPKRETAQLADLSGQADVVLVDAPCSGSGTWRRNPEARWRLTPARLDALVAQQGHVLDLALPLLKPGGRLVYAVCSLLDEEGSDQFETLLARSGLTARKPFDHAGRMRGEGVLLTPAGDGCDGFFVGVATR